MAAETLQSLASTSGLLETFASVAVLLIPAAVMGVVPKAGPGRALMLAARSLVRRADVVSRKEDASSLKLRSMLRHLGEQQYIVVTGQKGVGKSLLVNSVTQRTCGVVSVTVAPGTSERDIIEDALSAVANLSPRVSFNDPLASVRRVLWWYGWFLPRPIVVLRAGERKEGEAFAGFPCAVRVLAEYGLRIVVDGSTYSLPNELFATKRQSVLELEPMPRNTLRSIPEYADLFSTLRKENLEDVAWLVLGGVPAQYEGLRHLLIASNVPADHRRAVIVKYLRDEISNAIDRRDTMFAAHPAMEAIVELFKVQNEVPESELFEKGIVQPSPNKVLHHVLRDSVSKLVPTDAAMALVLRHDYKRTPPIEELMKLRAEDDGNGGNEKE